MSFASAFLTIAFLLAPGGQKPPLEAQDLLASINQKGASAVLKQLTSGDEREWNRVVSKIDMGSSAWLEVAQKLLPATDAGTTEDLYISLATALTHNPNGVLSMAGPNVAIERVCNVPFIEPTDRFVRQYRRKVRIALRGVTSQALSSKRSDCLKALGN